MVAPHFAWVSWFWEMTWSPFWLPLFYCHLCFWLRNLSLLVLSWDWGIAWLQEPGWIELGWRSGMVHLPWWTVWVVFSHCWGQGYWEKRLMECLIFVEVCRNGSRLCRTRESYKIVLVSVQVLEGNNPSLLYCMLCFISTCLYICIQCCTNCLKKYSTNSRLFLGYQVRQLSWTFF